MKWIAGGVTAARGFTASGIHAGIKRSRKPDLSLVVAEEGATAAAVFTRNRVQAAPVLISKARVRRGVARAVLINSGCANCLTGAEGLRDALRLGRALAEMLRVPEQEILLASTGLIGTRLPMARIRRAIPRLVSQLSTAHHEAAAQAILTTDLRVKETAMQAVINGVSVRLGGMAKGSGMIAPSMATMLCVLTTDAGIAPGFFRALLREAVEQTFNRISVDGDMSTNDTVFGLANGKSGTTIRAGTPAARTFAKLLGAVTERLAKLLVQDGEGATRIMEVRVVGARTPREAQACARHIACSPLVKTMLAGGDTNVGRIAAAAGASGAKFDGRLSIRVDGHRLVFKGVLLDYSTRAVRRLFARPEVQVLIDLHAGRAQGRMVTCDLTEEYVRINARYST